jgi:predicted MFS family arabinose efflux permease
VVLFTQTGMMVLAFGFAALVWSGHIQPWHILVLAALGGVAMAFDMPARQAFMVEMTSREDLMNAVSLNSSIFNGARVVGPAVAGLVMAHVGMAMCFLVNGLSFLAVIAGLLMMRLPKFVPPAEPASTGRHMLEGFAYVARHRRVRILLLLFAVVGVFGWSYSVLLPAYATDILHVGERGYGALLSANGLGALLGALTVATYGSRLRPRRMILGGLWLFSAMLLLLAVVRWYPLVLGCLAVGGWGMLLYYSTTNPLIQTSVSDDMRGRVMGIWALVFGGMMPVGGLESGLLSQAVGGRGVAAMFVRLHQCLRVAAQRKTSVRRFLKQGHGLISSLPLPLGDVHRHQRHTFAPVKPGNVEQAHRPAANPAILRGCGLALQPGGHRQIGRVAAAETFV